MRVITLLVLLICCRSATSDDFVVPDDIDFEGVSTGSGDCWETTNILWAKCGSPPSACSSHTGNPVPDNPKILYQNGDYFLIPQWTYECPETGGGVTNIGQVPSVLCIKKTNMGKSAQVYQQLICWTATECDADAVASNVYLTENGIKKKKWRFADLPQERAQPTDEGNLGANYWEEIDELVFPKSSHCKGDANHPIANYPAGMVPKNCNTTNCQ